MAGTVYVVTSDYCESRNIYKIGCTKDYLGKRINKLNNSFCTAELRLRCVKECKVTDARRYEKELHSTFENKRRSREFFELDGDDLDELKNMMQQRALRDASIETRTDIQSYFDNSSSMDNEIGIGTGGGAQGSDIVGLQIREDARM